MTTQPDTGLRELGLAMRSIRNSRGMKQSELAEAVDMANATISSIETGRRSASLNTFFDLCEALQVPSFVLVYIIDRRKMVENGTLDDELRSVMDSLVVEYISGVK